MYALSGTVRLPDESPVAGATIIVVRQSTDEVAGTATTDESGAWSVDGLDNAKYDAYVRVDGKTAPAMTGVVPSEVLTAPTITITTAVEPLEVGQTRQLVVSVTGSPTPVVTYESDDEAVATVDGDGLVTAVAEGECMITATATNSEGQDSDTYALEVEAADEPGGTDIVWIPSHAYVEVDGNTVTKTGGPHDDYYYADAGQAASQQEVVSGDCEVSCEWDGSHGVALTLHHGTQSPTGQGNPNDDFHIVFIDDGWFECKEGSTYRHAIENGSAGDRFSIAIVGDTIEFRHNGATVHTLSSPTINYPLRAHAVFRNVGASLVDCHLTTG